MRHPSTARPSIATRIVTALQANLGRTLAIVAAITVLLVIPFLTMAPTESASTEPAGDVFTARDRIDDTFASTVRGIGFVIEDPEGDILRAEPLSELFAAQQRLRADSELGPTMFTYFEVESTRDVTGILSLADLVDTELRSTENIGLDDATDAQVKAAGAALIERLGVRSNVLNLSTRTTQASDGSWVVPAISPVVLADDTVLGFGATSVNLGGDTEPEVYDREVQDILRSAENLRVNGIAIDVNLTSQEQGAIAGPFIGFTILAVLVMVGFTFRSYWVLATVSAAFVLLIVWLKGISNLIGLKDDLVLSLIVPIAMISFGVDFAFHAIGRYREDRARGASAAPAIATGLAAVSGALLLALVSDSMAFLANVTSGIESITQFGVGAAIALASAYLLLGVVTPLVVARIEADVPPPTPGRRATALAHRGCGRGGGDDDGVGAAHGVPAAVARDRDRRTDHRRHRRRALPPPAQPTRRRSCRRRPGGGRRRPHLRRTDRPNDQRDRPVPPAGRACRHRRDRGCRRPGRAGAGSVRRRRLLRCRHGLRRRPRPARRTCRRPRRRAGPPLRRR
jgi:hypothetical protein